MGPPEFSHQIESFLLRQTPSCFTAGPRIYTGLPAPDTFLLYSRPHIYTGLPALDTFLLYSRPRIYTGLSRPAWAPVLLPVLFPFVPNSVLPRQGIPDKPPNILPVVRVPGRERRLLETMQLAIGEFITDSSQGLPPSPRVCGRKAPSPNSLRYLLGTIISWHKWIGYTVGSWCKRIGYTVARQFFVGLSAVPW